MPTSTDMQPDLDLDALIAEAGWVQALARRLARNQAEAEDIAQGALVLALERQPAVRDGLRPWLARVITRLARHAVRSDDRRRAREALAAACCSGLEPGVNEHLQRLELQQELARRVGALPDPYRAVLIRRFYLHMSVKEIASVTDTTSGTVRSQLGRGLERLREQYAREADGPPSLGVFLVAAGYGDGASWGAAELSFVDVSFKKVTLAAVALITLCVATFGFREGLELRPTADSATATTNTARTDAGPATPDAATPAVAISRTAATQPSPEPLATSPVTDVAAGTLTSKVRARVLGVDRQPLSGAVLRSVHADGRPRGTDAFAHSDADGRVELALTDGSLRRWRDEVFDMTFAVSAAGHATTFRLKRPRLHGETDLGTVILQPGGALVGTCIDELGRPVAGAVVCVGGEAVAGDPRQLRLRGPGQDVARLRGLTAADGTFALTGIEAFDASGRHARVRLWAKGPGGQWTLSEPFSVTPHGQIDAGVVVLEDAPAERCIRGAIYRPDGRPAAGARIDYLSTGSSHHGHVFADDRGGFLVLVRDAEPVQLVGRDPSRDLGTSAVAIARGGEQVDLALRNRRTLTVRVIDAEGEPLADTDVMPVLPVDPTDAAQGESLLPGQRWLSTDANGAVDLVVPGQVFAVVARRVSSGPRTVGPLDPNTVPSVLSIELPRGPEVSGRVLAHGRPVVGARVAVMHRYEGFAAMTGGFPNRYRSGAPTVPTDADGRFSAPVDPAWPSVGVIARADGFAAGEAELRGIRPGAGATGIEIQLTEGGAIEGRLIPPAGAEPASLHVAASRGDGLPVSTAVGEDGLFRLTGLTPGRWRVEGRLREVRTEMMSTSTDSTDLEPRWNVEVVDGQTSRIDLDMRLLGAVELRGVFRIDGSAPPAGWTVEVLPPIDLRGPVGIPTVALDRRGEFVVIAPAGRVTIALSGPLEEGVTTEVTRQIELIGPQTTWESTLHTARLTTTLGAGPRHVRLVRQSAGTVDREVTRIPLARDGLVVARVPVGQSRLELPAHGDKQRWTVLRELIVR